MDVLIFQTLLLTYIKVHLDAKLDHLFYILCDSLRKKPVGLRRFFVNKNENFQQLVLCYNLTYGLHCSISIDGHLLRLKHMEKKLQQSTA